MFGFATNEFGGNRCFDDGCNCICETSAKDDGTCDMVPNISYRLYKFKTPGNYRLKVLPVKSKYHLLVCFKHFKDF